MSNERACKACGCTERRACPGGCAWIDEDVDVCTSCASAVMQHDPEVMQRLARRDMYAASALAMLAGSPFAVDMQPLIVAARVFDIADAMLVESVNRELPAEAFPHREVKEPASGIVLG